MLRVHDDFKANWIYNDFGNAFHRLTQHNLEIMLAFLSCEGGAELKQKYLQPDSFYNLSLAVAEHLPHNHTFNIKKWTENGKDEQVVNQKVATALEKGLCPAKPASITYELVFSLDSLLFFHVEATECVVNNCITLSDLAIRYTADWEQNHTWEQEAQDHQICDLLNYNRFLPLR